MIYAVDLTKHYGATLALDRFSLTIPEGAVYGLLGPNGSGKTTFIKLLLGLIFPDLGQLQRGGLALQQIGYLPGAAGLAAAQPHRRVPRNGGTTERPARPPAPQRSRSAPGPGRDSAGWLAHALAPAPKACCSAWGWPWHC